MENHVSNKGITVMQDERDNFHITSSNISNSNTTSRPGESFWGVHRLDTKSGQNAGSSSNITCIFVSVHQQLHHRTNINTPSIFVVFLSNYLGQVVVLILFEIQPTDLGKRVREDKEKGGWI